MAGHEVAGGAQAVWPTKLSPLFGRIALGRRYRPGSNTNVVPGGLASTTLWIAVPGVMVTEAPEYVEKFIPVTLDPLTVAGRLAGLKLNLFLRAVTV